MADVAWSAMPTETGRAQTTLRSRRKIRGSGGKAALSKSSVFAHK